MIGWELPEMDLSEIDKLPGISSSLMWALSVELQNEELQTCFAALGKGKRNYTCQQKKFVLSQLNNYGVRATSRILQIPRRTIQRWCREYHKVVSRCPDWVYEWAERRRKRREFWEYRGYC